MASPVGHTLVGATIAYVGLQTKASSGARSWRRRALAVGLGVLAASWADLEGLADTLTLGVFRYASHRSIFHSLPLAVVAGAFLAELGVRLRVWPRRRSYLVAILAACSHPLLDWANGGWGVPLFWPLSTARYASPWPVLGSPPLGLWGIVAWNFLLWDLIVFVPGFVASVLLCRARAGGTHRAFCVVVGLILSLFTVMMLAVSHYTDLLF